MLRRIAAPVLEATAAGRLRATMPVEAHDPPSRARYTHLEAIGRLLAGMAPWLELDAPSLDATERELQARFRQLALQTIANATDPASPDYCLWDDSIRGQPLVDASFLGHALLRAPRQLHDALDAPVRQRLADCLRRTRAITPGQNNWLLFSAMVEAALFRFTGEFQLRPVRYAVDRHRAWYKGDGAYGDGQWFHWDYYNSFVIQPMLLDVLEVLRDEHSSFAALLPKQIERAKRFAAVQERLIAPDGTFPPIGRSLCYRAGCFQHLAQMALRRQLPEPLTPAQIRCALTAVIRRTHEPPGTFDDNGWLTLGLAGHQPMLAEGYVSTGSTYLTATAFLPLGLPPGDSFWADPDQPWTAQLAWSGQPTPIDHSMHDSKPSAWKRFKAWAGYR